MDHLGSFLTNDIELLKRSIEDISNVSEDAKSPIIILDNNKNFTAYKHKWGYIYYKDPCKVCVDSFINMRHNAHRKSPHAFIICDDVKHFKIDLYNYSNRGKTANITLYGYSPKKSPYMDYIEKEP